MVVEKSARRLSVFRNREKLKSYSIALGSNPVGPKEREGDLKTPEGIYRIDYRNPKSAFHLSLHISYPSAADTARAAALGVSAWLGHHDPWPSQRDRLGRCVGIGAGLDRRDVSP